MQANIHSVLDIEDMVVSACVRNKRIVNRIFQECGEKVSANSTIFLSCIYYHIPNNMIFFTHSSFFRSLNLFAGPVSTLGFYSVVYKQLCGYFMMVTGFFQYAVLLWVGLQTTSR